MNESQDDVRMNVYEIGYLIASSVPEEKVSSEAEAVKSIITKAGASVIAEEIPHLENLAYTMRKKTVSGSYDKYNTAYFGWIKFEVGSNTVESIKKEVEVYPSVLRMLMISTVKENTYLGKRASAIAAEFVSTNKRFSADRTDRVAPTEKAPFLITKANEDEKVAPSAPASVEDMDKSIDAMVKEV
ncbi:MAG: 30S ribosomal protein S6 [Candidatus Taylorbacteria bacterium]